MDLNELKSLDCKKIIVIPKNDLSTQNAAKKDNKTAFLGFLAEAPV